MDSTGQFRHGNLPLFYTKHKVRVGQARMLVNTNKTTLGLDASLKPFFTASSNLSITF